VLLVVVLVWVVRVIMGLLVLVVVALMFVLGRVRCR
jgi:hypothetical protein